MAMTGGDEHRFSLEQLAKSVQTCQDLPRLIPILQAATHQEPQNHYICSLYGAALQNSGNMQAAATQFTTLHQQVPQAIEPILNLISCFYHLGDWDAHAHFIQKGKAINPNHADLLYQTANSLLLHGEYEQGFFHYEKRLESSYMQGQKILRFFNKLNHVSPLTPTIIDQGQLAGKSLLLLGEQGNGDMIMAMRYMDAFAKTGMKLYYMGFHQALQPLLEQQNLPCTMLKAGDSIEQLDYYAPLLSLGSILSYKDKADIPPPFAFKVKPLSTPKSNMKRIGIVHSGQAQNYWNALRTIPLSQLMASLHPFRQKAEFIYLSKEIPAQDANIFHQYPYLQNWGKDQKNFYDLAQHIHQMDGVITIDTAAAHLAASMGKPCHILLSYVPDWRWREKGHSDFYPNAQLIRQTRFGDWKDALQQLNQAVMFG